MTAAAKETHMKVLAFAGAAADAWRWRIVDYNRHIVEESSVSVLDDRGGGGRQRLVWPAGRARVSRPPCLGRSAQDGDWLRRAFHWPFLQACGSFLRARAS